MEKKLNYIQGFITDISDTITVNTPNRKPYKKKIITIFTEDNQKLFGEVREYKFPWLEKLRMDGKLLFGYSFEGSEKNEKKYNNIYIQSIKPFK